MAEEHELEQEQELVNKYGKPLTYDVEFHGPLWRERSCTDVPCLLIFGLFLAGWGFIAHYAIHNGDLNKLMVPTDSFNQKCGIDSQVLDKPYLFFFNLDKCIDPVVPLTGCPTPQVCVKSCPTETFIWDTQKNSLSFEEIKKRLVCLTDADKDKVKSMADAERAINEERCARWYIKSAPLFNRCMWELSPEVCEYIPSFLLKRNRRDALSNISSLSLASHAETFNELQLQALALTAAAPEQRIAPKTVSKLDLQNEPIVQCRSRAALGETVIKEKMRQTDTRLAKFVGNMVQIFYNGTHDAQQLGEAIVEDLVNSWFIIFMSLVFTLVAALIFIALMRWLAGPILWFSIIGVLLGLIVGTYYSFSEYFFWRKTPTVPNHSLNLNSQVKNILQDSTVWLIISIFMCVSFVVILLLVIILRQRIRIATALIKEGSKAVSSVISTVFFPIFSWILFIVVIVFALVVGLYLGSIGDPYFRLIKRLDSTSITGVSTEICKCEGPAVNYTVGEQCDPQTFQQYCYIGGSDSGGGFFQQNQRSPCQGTTCSFVKIKNPTLVKWFIFYDVFGFFWLTFFVSAFSDMVLAATFATWYWTYQKKDVPFWTLSRSFAQTGFYHLGTLAFGSLILAICRMIRIALEYIDEKLKKYDNAVTRAILCIMKCFFWLLENFLRFLNRNAYIMCAIHGKNFCGSAKDAFNLVMRNFLRVVTLDQVTDFLFFLSKILLTASAGVATYYFLANHPQLLQLNFNAVPTAVVVIAAFLITSVFFSVYSMAVDTLFLCFLEDCERNDGSSEKPYYMSKQLMSILGKRNKSPRRQNSSE